MNFASIFNLEVNKKLIENTLKWLSERHIRFNGKNIEKCDEYMVNVLEILIKGIPTIKEQREKGPNAGR